MPTYNAKYKKPPFFSGPGGKREGAGRPRSGKFTRSIFVTDTEHKAVIRFILGLRKKPAVVL